MTKHSDSTELTRLSGEQAEERTAREEMTKHTDTSRSIDSGVSGNAQTGAREIRSEPAHCMIRGCIMTMGFGIGGGAHICWLHRLAAPKVDKALRKCGAKEVGLFPSFRSKAGYRHSINRSE